MSAKATRKNKKKKGFFGVLGSIFGSLLSVLLTLLLIGVITGIIVCARFAIYCRDYLIDDDYDIKDLQYSLDMTTKIYYPEYSDIGRTQLVGYHEMEDQRIHGTENRFWASVNDMPDNLKNAFIAIEDKRFYTNNGIDIKRTLGATLMFVGGNKSYGGSTITQQLIKNITGERDSTIQRKVTEISRAISLTKKHTKSEIIEMYLNTIPLSHGCYGVSAAADYYFSKEVKDLTLVECAALAAIPKSPTKYDPKRNPEFNKQRRDTVLDEMHNQELISDEEFQEALNTELVLNIKINEPSNVIYSYFTEALRQQVVADLVEEGYTKELANQMILSGGLEIYATVDPFIQNAMEEVYADPSTFVKVDDGVQPQSAMVVMEPHTGDVLGIIGGRGEKTGNLTLNRATKSTRQIGSSIKPISVYAPALDMGLITMGSVIDDTPVEFKGSMGRYWPKNSPAVYDGKCTISRAIAVSKNTAAVKILQELSYDYSYKFLTEKCGITTLVESDLADSPLALGGLTYGISPLEVAGAYSMLANDGIHVEPRFYTRVVDSRGNEILSRPRTGDSVVAVDKSTAQIMTKLLTGVVNTGTGTGVTLRHKIEVAGKTGTTNKNYDVYFVGYTPYYLGATWFGYDQNRSLAKFGANQALAGWDKVMNKIHERVFEQESGNLRKFDYSGLVTASYCKDSGMAPGVYCRSDVRGSRIETAYYKPGTEPKETCDCHVPMKWDTSTGCIASEYCPDEVCSTRSFVKVGNERIFSYGVTISDARYTMMELPDPYPYPTVSTVSIFDNLFAYGNYGFARNAGVVPPNAYCTFHTAPVEVEPSFEDPEGGSEGSDGNREEPPVSVDVPVDGGETPSTGTTPPDTGSDAPDDGHEDVEIGIDDILGNTGKTEEKTESGPSHELAVHKTDRSDETGAGDAGNTGDKAA